MRSYRIVHTSGIDGLKLVDEPRPTPGPGQVLVHVKATSLNFRDLLILTGAYPFPGGPGNIALSDAAGVVEAVGEGVTRFAVGDRVVNSFNPDWMGGVRRSLGAQYVVSTDGWLTEYKAVSEHVLVGMPDHLDFTEAATLPCAAVTAWSALAGVGPGDTVLTQGTGGVSLFAVQLAKALGARVIATTSSPAKADRLRALGADEVVNRTEVPEWGDHVRALTDGRGVDRVVEVAGPATIAQSVRAIASRGEISLVGFLAREGPAFDLMGFFLSASVLRPISVGSRADLEELVRVLTRHSLHPVVDRVFPFLDAPAALAHLSSGGERFGKTVITH